MSDATTKPEGQRPSTPQSHTSPTDESLRTNSMTEKSVALDDGASDHKAKDTTPEMAFVPKALLMMGLIMTFFLVALDRSIIATAIPKITDEFNSLTDVGWYGSSYLLTCCALQLLFGKIYSLFSTKTVLLTCILIFEAASALCGAAPTSVAFIIGRAISGIGAAGIFTGVITSLLHFIPLDKRPKIQGLFGAMMGIAQITGPLIGGGFTTKVTWRWCFYINLPIGGLAMIAIWFFLQVPDKETTKQPLKKKLLQLDVLGTALVAPGAVCLLLALQWGGQTYSWSNGRVIALLTLSIVLLIAFVAVQVLMPSTATLPPRIFKSRTVVAAVFLTVCTNTANFTIVYFLPIWFQTVTGVSAIESGIRTLPMVLATVCAAIPSGILTSKIGYYTPFAIAGACLTTIGAGLLTTLEVDTSTGKWIGYQIIYGFGFGMVFQVPNLATQTVLSKKDTPIGISLNLFSALLAASVFLSIGENVLGSQLLQRFSAIPGFNGDLLSGGGVTSVLNTLPADLKAQGLQAYNEALKRVFIVALIPNCLTILGAASLEWKNVKVEAKRADQQHETVETEEKK